jgi:ABC-2 type transport system ATP-binding protein
MNEPLIAISHLKKSFGTRSILQDVSLRVAPGTIFGLVGLNGAGKTTLLRLLLGLLKADAGQCTVLGMDPALQQKAYYRRIGVVLEHSGFFENCTVRENVRFFARVKGVSRPAAEEYYTRWWSGLSIDRHDRKVKLFSRGQKMQCAILRAFLGWPEVYFFDEPVVALDMTAYDHFCRLARHARERGAAIVISSHQLDAIEELCDEVAILEDGRLTMLDTLRKDQDGTPWIICGSDGDGYGRLIEQLCGQPAVYRDGQWHFTVPADPDCVPRIVTALAGQGCLIREVRPARAERLRESIRRHYEEPRDAAAGGGHA